MELLHRRCCGLDVHKETVVACLRLVSDGKVTTGSSYLPDDHHGGPSALVGVVGGKRLHADVAMEATGVYWFLSVAHLG